MRNSYKAKKGNQKDRQQRKEEVMEQKQELSDRINGLVDTIASQTDEALASETFQEWLRVQSQFHNYSYNNTMLIMMQKPESTRVAGFKKWQSVGRFVKKGEKSIKILAPSTYKKTVEVTKDDGTVEQEEKKLMYFRVVSVFDISQTDGEDLPELDYRTQGDDGGVVDLLEQFIKENGISLKYVDEKELGGAKGCSRGGEINILDTLIGAERASTITHEIAHELLHKGDVDPLTHTRSVKEIEAEATAAVVLSALGFDMSGSRFYLACWEGDSKKVKESLGNITKASKEILTFLEERLPKKDASKKDEQQVAA